MSDDHRKNVVRTFDQLWDDFQQMPKWDRLSQTILDVLKRELGSVAGLTVLEAGSGTGRISFELGAVGADVWLLDASPKAMELSQRLFRDHQRKGSFILGSIFDLPFDSGYFDVVWNAGVLEHFLEAGQVLALCEMLRVCKDGGIVITINPYRYSICYRIGKWYMEKHKLWKVGYEQPIGSLRRVARMAGVSVSREYPCGFADSIDFLPNVRGAWRAVRFLRRMEKSFRFLQRFGYLLVTVLRK